MEMRVLIARITNALRKKWAGLRLHGENVSPEVPNDLFRAHESIYHFAGTLAQGRRVLDIGCGSGYGSRILQTAGAVSVLGVDVDDRNIAYARRRFGSDGIAFQVGDAADLRLDRTFDMIVASNMLEHLVEIGTVLPRIIRLLDADGVMIAALPPIFDERTLADNQANPYHRTNLSIHEWHALLSECFATVRLFEHHGPDDHVLDFNAPFTSRVDPRTFRFAETTLADFPRCNSLTALFVAERPTPSA
jgi:SAM-dependent methyltransferase